MSEGTPAPPDKTPPAGKGALKDAIDKGVDPAKIKPVKEDPWEVDFQLVDGEEPVTQESFKRLADNFNKLTEYTVKKDVLAKRQVILDEIKELDPESYEEEKDNQTINELEKVRTTLRRVKPKADTKRDVGAVDKDKATPEPDTQWDHLKAKFKPG